MTSSNPEHDARLIATSKFGRDTDDLIATNFQTDNDLRRCAKYFRLSEAEIRYIVTHRDKVIPAGYRR